MSSGLATATTGPSFCDLLAGRVQGDGVVSKKKEALAAGLDLAQGHPSLQVPSYS